MSVAGPDAIIEDNGSSSSKLSLRTSVPPLSPPPPLTGADLEYESYLMKVKGEDFTDMIALNFLYIAGNDSHGRPIVVVIGANLPAATIDLERVTLYSISVLDRIVEADYVLIYAHTNMSSSSKPGFSWLRKMYSIFNRKYKKNLKFLYIIHPTLWVKMTFVLFKPFISTKFWRKLVYIDTSADITNFFHRGQSFLPDYVLNDGKVLPKLVFGKKLEDVVRQQAPAAGGLDVPVIVTKAIALLTKRGVQTEGIFRLSGNVYEIKDLKTLFNSGKDVDLDRVEDPHAIAGLLKLYFRELPVPLFPYNFYDAIIQLARTSMDKEERIRKMCSMIDMLPKPNRATVHVLFTFLALVAANSQANKMTTSNLAIIMGPNLIRNANESIESAMRDAGAINLFVATLIQAAIDHPTLFQ